jgi:hypothetical protein
MATKRNTRGQVDAGDSKRTDDVRRPSASSTPTKRYRVREGTQVAHEERVFAEGEQLEAPEGVAREWLTLGYVEEVEPRPKRKSTGS